MKHGLAASASSLNLKLSLSKLVPPSKVLSYLRAIRPESVETKAQEDFLKQYYSCLCKRAEQLLSQNLTVGLNLVPDSHPMATGEKKKKRRPSRSPLLPSARSLTSGCSSSSSNTSSAQATPGIPSSLAHPTLHKFPRTSHLLNPGGTAVTRDDLLLPPHEAALFYADAGKSKSFTVGGIKNRIVIVQEKVDGANLGISLTSDFKFVFQNRSSFVTAASGTQWKALDTWVAAHRHELLEFMEPNRHVLFGEWCRIQHSVFYDQLPDTFVAFDLYDSQAHRPSDSKEKQALAKSKKSSSSNKILSGRFYSHARLQKILQETSIVSVPVLTKQKFDSASQLLELLESQSAYRKTGFLEGIYLRIDGEDYLESRCKLVRPDFVQGIEEHWSKGQPVKNIVSYDRE